MSDKEKAYVETTVISDATALPTNIFSGLWHSLRNSETLGRPFATNEWWKANSPDKGHPATWMVSPVLAPAYGPAGFYRVLAAPPYAPSK